MTDCRQQMRSLHSDRQIKLHYVGMDTPADSTEFYDRHNMKCLQDISTIKQKETVKGQKHRESCQHVHCQGLIV